MRERDRERDRGKERVRRGGEGRGRRGGGLTHYSHHSQLKGNIGMHTQSR